MPSFEDRFVSVRGVKTRYWQAGSEGSAVILLHGIGCSVLDWQTNIAALEIEYSDAFNEAALTFLAEVDRSEVGAPAASQTATAVIGQQHHVG